MSAQARTNRLAWIAGVVIPLLVPLWLGAVAYGKVQSEMERCKVDVAELRIAKTKSTITLARIETDVLWIRKTLEELKEDRGQ